MNSTPIKDQASQPFWHKALATGGLRLATWILAGTSLPRRRAPLSWNLKTFETPIGPKEGGRLFEDVSHFENTPVRAHLHLSTHGGCTFQIEFPAELHSYARVLAALREKGFIP